MLLSNDLNPSARIGSSKSGVVFAIYIPTPDLFTRSKKLN
jgi:hypothetical protein